jgi:hypothetical protein
MARNISKRKAHERKQAEAVAQVLSRFGLGEEQAVTVVLTGSYREFAAFLAGTVYSNPLLYKNVSCLADVDRIRGCRVRDWLRIGTFGNVPEQQEIMDYVIAMMGRR